MIVEAIVGGTVVVLAAVGTRCLYRSLRAKLACWFGSPHMQVPQHHGPLPDPTPSFTVELVRTVLEHQARREDQSRREVTLLMMQIATARQCDGCSSIPFLDGKEKPLPQHAGDVVANARNGMVARTIRRLLPGLQ